MTAKSPTASGIDWNRVLPHLESIHRADLHLSCGDEIVFFDPVKGVGLLWRSHHEVAQMTGPITAPEFVRAMIARGVQLPRGAEMRKWSNAITAGEVITAYPEKFLEIARFMDAMADGRTVGGVH